MDIGAHEWGQALSVAAPPAGGFSNDARATQLTALLPHAGVRPWAPAHLRARQGASGDLAISWVRCARVGGDFWGAGEPPIGFGAEAYQLDIFDGATLKRSVTVSTPS